MQCPVGGSYQEISRHMRAVILHFVTGELLGSVLAVILLGELEQTGRQAHPPIQAGFSLLAFAVTQW